ncbi:hypothetical protein HYPSUDRAFT_818412 [Hypholoma sublateritium FD-334 SS-4]|uniref:Uncharacterized protein n=1 Tax=Hypholoma sublateritium (strain FD-334 SS-4) TaxID=945553 RepID=A0A0D2PK93_HYPSF|nr:hypothetical protein HYPSUDRAFT_818412 [Hypholoma sublateritium FD-334 SS-4]
MTNDEKGVLLLVHGALAPLSYTSFASAIRCTSPAWTPRAPPNPARPHRLPAAHSPPGAERHVPLSPPPFPTRMCAASREGTARHDHLRAAASPSIRAALPHGSPAAHSPPDAARHARPSRAPAAHSPPHPTRPARSSSHIPHADERVSVLLWPRAGVV